MKLEADTFLGAASKEVIVGQHGIAPNFAIQHVIALEFDVFFGVGFDDDDFTFVTEGDDFVSRENDLAGAKASLFPDVFASFDVNTGQRSCSIFFEAEHAIEKAIFHDWGAPVIEALVFTAPDLLSFKVAAVFADFESTCTHAVTS